MRILEKFIYTQRMEMRRKIGEVFKAGRLDVGWSIEEASQASGISNNAIQKIENGECNSHIYSLFCLERLAACYGKHLQVSLTDISSEDYLSLREPLFRLLIKKFLR